MIWLILSVCFWSCSRQTVYVLLIEIIFRLQFWDCFRIWHDVNFSLWSTGWEASSEVKGCTDGWVEFICQHNPTHQYQSVDVVKNNHTIIGSTQKNVWQTKNIFSVYYDAANRKLRVVIKPLQHGDSGEYKCTFIFGKSESDKVDLNIGKKCCLFLSLSLMSFVKALCNCVKE